jgi:hypothetical protein
MTNTELQEIVAFLQVAQLAANVEAEELKKDAIDLATAKFTKANCSVIEAKVEPKVVKFEK